MRKSKLNKNASEFYSELIDLMKKLSLNYSDLNLEQKIDLLKNIHDECLTDMDKTDKFNIVMEAQEKQEKDELLANLNSQGLRFFDSDMFKNFSPEKKAIAFKKFDYADSDKPEFKKQDGSKFGIKDYLDLINRHQDWSIYLKAMASYLMAKSELENISLDTLKDFNFNA